MQKTIYFIYLMLYALIATFAIASEKNTENPIIIDVRTEQEFSTEHVEQALNIHYKNISAHIENHAPDKGTPIIVYCGIGARAALAKHKLESIGYTNVENGGGLKTMLKRFPGKTASTD